MVGQLHVIDRVHVYTDVMMTEILLRRGLWVDIDSPVDDSTNEQQKTLADRAALTIACDEGAFVYRFPLKGQPLTRIMFLFCFRCPSPDPQLHRLH